jgi:response regulator RpfG family c-di-GMP phosphodiesterase
VLFAEDDRDTLDMYSTFLEMQGMWVARANTSPATIDSVLELRPDIVIADLGPGDAGRDGAELIHAIKSRPDTQHIPVIVLTGQSPQQMSDETRGEAELFLLKPVLPDDLLQRARALLEQSQRLRERTDRAEQRTAELAQRVAEAKERAQELREERRQSRCCPGCGRRLEFIERTRIRGVEYDYYRWCGQGCGLYCFDRSAARWVKLA